MVIGQLNSLMRARRELRRLAITLDSNIVSEMMRPNPEPRVAIVPRYDRRRGDWSCIHHRMGNP